MVVGTCIGDFLANGDDDNIIKLRRLRGHTTSSTQQIFGRVPQISLSHRVARPLKGDIKKRLLNNRKY